MSLNSLPPEGGNVQSVWDARSYNTAGNGYFVDINQDVYMLAGTQIWIDYRHDSGRTRPVAGRIAIHYVTP
jgi:hypothetical protein